MKTKLIILLCATVLLWGCGIDEKYITKQELQQARHFISLEIEEGNSRYDSLQQRIDRLEWRITAEEDKTKCVPFMPKIWDIVYQDITDEEVSNDDFYLQYGEIIRKKWRKYFKMDVQSYAVEWDCVVYINQMWHDWVNKL